MEINEIDAVAALLHYIAIDSGLKTAVRVLSKTRAVKVTLRGPVRACHTEVLVTIGKPAYRERQKIAKEGTALPADFLYTK